MNYATLYGTQVQPISNGPLALDNRARSFWQSRSTSSARGVAPLPELVDIRALAIEVRATYREASCNEC